MNPNYERRPPEGLYAFAVIHATDCDPYDAMGIAYIMQGMGVDMAGVVAHFFNSKAREAARLLPELREVPEYSIRKSGLT